MIDYQRLVDLRRLVTRERVLTEPWGGRDRDAPGASAERVPHWRDRGSNRGFGVWPTRPFDSRVYELCDKPPRNRLSVARHCGDREGTEIYNNNTVVAVSGVAGSQRSRDSHAKSRAADQYLSDRRKRIKTKGRNKRFTPPKREQDQAPPLGSPSAFNPAISLPFPFGDDSNAAVEVNIAIMRTFVQLRRLMDSNRELARKINSLEKKYDEQFAVVFKAIKQLLSDDEARMNRSKRRIGFNQ